MKELTLSNTVIKYQIAFKKNKNTYFYFKKNGYIQINASKKQKEKEIIKFIKNNEEVFLKKLKKAQERYSHKEGYYLFGLKYEIIEDSNLQNIKIDHELFTINQPNIDIDQLSLQYKKEEKRLLLNTLSKIEQKYLNNGYVNIQNIKIKTRYTTSRFGSCNYKLRTINFNLELVHYDPKYIEYVFLHEIAHLTHQNHSSEFYDLLLKLCPNYKTLKKELNSIFKR